MTNERAITIIDDVNAYLASRSIYENDSIAGYTYRVICEALTQLKQSALAIKTSEQTDVLEKIRAEILDEAEFAYADFDRYKEDILHAEPDELPDDDFRYGLERAVEIINKYRKGGAE